MLFQGSDREKDRANLWPDLMCLEAGPKAKSGPQACVCVCDDLEDAKAMQAALEARGCLDRCTIFIPNSSGPGARMIASAAALAFAEQLCDDDGEVTVIFDLEPMHRIWNILAEVAGAERR